jgi:hypothetical protein
MMRQVCICDPPHIESTSLAVIISVMIARRNAVLVGNRLMHSLKVMLDSAGHN